jgi:hypothetical protein
MAHKYAKSWFLIDACSSVPAETATMIAEAIAAQEICMFPFLFTQTDANRNGNIQSVRVGIIIMIH